MLWPELQGRRLTYEIIRRMINSMASDLFEQTRTNLAKHDVRTLDDVRRAPQIVAYSPAMRAELGELKRFLLTRLYRHYQVLRMASKAARIVTDLFEAFMADHRLLPPQYQHSDERRQSRAIADYIAGMTDRYAYKEHRRLFAVTEYL